MSDFLQTLKLRSRLLSISSKVPKDKLIQEVNMVLDGQLGAMLVRLNSLKSLTAKNLAGLEELKEGERYVKAALTKLAADASADQLTVQDMNFFNKLVFMRHRKEEQPEPKPQPDILVQTPRTVNKLSSSTKDTTAGPFQLLKAFDDMYNNKDVRLEQLIEAKASLQPQKTKVMRRNQNKSNMLSNYNSRNLPQTPGARHEHIDFDEASASRHQDYDSKLSESNATPLVSGYSHIESMRRRGDDSRSTAGTDPQQVMFDYHNELVELGNKILAISEEEIELEGTKQKKKKPDILKELRFVQKYKAEIQAKLHIVKEFIMSTRSKREGISNEVLFERLARLSKPKKVAAPPAEPEDEPKPEGKFLSEEQRQEFVERNYEKFLKKYNDKMRLIEEKLQQEQLEDEEAQKRRANVPEIDPETDILKLTASMLTRKKENEDHLRQLKGEASKKGSFKDSPKPSNSSLNLSSPHKRSKSDYDQVKSKIDSWTKPFVASDLKSKKEPSLGTPGKTAESFKDVKKFAKSILIPEPFDSLPKTKKEAELSQLTGERKTQTDGKMKVSSDQKKPMLIESRPPMQNSARELKKQPVVAVHKPQTTKETLTEKKQGQKPKPVSTKELESPTVKKAKQSVAAESKQQSEVGTPLLKKSTRSSQKKIDVQALPPVELPATCFVTPVKEEACPPLVTPDQNMPGPNELPDEPSESPTAGPVVGSGYIGIGQNSPFKPSLNPSKVDSIHEPAKLLLYNTLGQAAILPLHLLELDENPTSTDEAKRRMSIYNSIAHINKSINSINHNKSHIEKSLSRQSSQGHLAHGQDKNEDDFLVFDEDSFDPNKMLLEEGQVDRNHDKSLSLEGDKGIEKQFVEPEPQIRGSLVYFRPTSELYVSQKYRSDGQRTKDVEKASICGQRGCSRRRPDPRTRGHGRVRL